MEKNTTFVNLFLVTACFRLHAIIDQPRSILAPPGRLRNAIHIRATEIIRFVYNSLASSLARSRKSVLNY